MKIDFFKYHGTGNDFILIDNRNGQFPAEDHLLIEKMCHRNFGIGADGLMLLENHPELDFRMVYFNSDGKEGSMCGNGGRCMVLFAKHLGIIGQHAEFMAVDGVHKAEIQGDTISLKMSDVKEVEIATDYIFLDTGSPHHVIFSQNVTDDIDVFNIGKKIRYEKYGETGANVNFVEKKTPSVFKIRTYERGVENETLSCGTGVVAAALAMTATKRTESNPVFLETMGGQLQVHFEIENGVYTNIFLTGPAKRVFKGIWEE